MAKSNSSRTGQLPSLNGVSVKVAPALKSAWDKHMAVLTKAQGQGAKAFDELWEAVDAIVNHTPPLYVVGDFATANAFFEGVLKETPRTAQRNIRVARFASPAHEQRYGVAALDAALGYLQAKNGAPLSGHEPIDFDRVMIPVTAKGKTTRLGLGKATVKQIAAATAALTGAGRKRPSSEAFKAVARELSAVSPLSDVSVRESAGVFTFERVPSAALEHFANAVLRGARTAPAKTAAPKKKPRSTSPNKG